jgi:tetratricopeptide (TPR) repeat protein
MRKVFWGLALIGGLAVGSPLEAQTPCPSFSVVVNTPEDELMLAINGADKPQDQIAALDKYSKDHADSKFTPCVNEYYTMTYLKMNNYDKAIEYGEKDLAANYLDLNLLSNLMRAYVASGKVSDSVLDAVMKVPDEIKTEMNPSRPPNANDADWQKIQQEAAQQADDSRAFAVYAFFQLMPRVADATKRIDYLDKFTKAFPDAETKYAAQINNAYFQAYQLANNADKALEYGEKAIAADPNNLMVCNAMAYTYAIVKRSNLDKASEYARKALTLGEAMKKPDGVSDADFKNEQDNQLGMAHLTLGYVSFLKAGKSRRVGPAIQELKSAADLFGGNPGLRGQALFYLGNAYEFEYPANHGAAIEALSKASGLAGPWQSSAKELLGKVRKAAGQ